MGERLAGEVAVISGGTKGIGEAMVRRFAHEGCAVVFNGRTAELGEALEAELRSAGAAVTFVQADVTSYDDVRATIDTALDRHGRLTVLVNNTSAMGSGAAPGADVESRVRSYEDYLAIGLCRAVVFPVEYALPSLIEAGGGSIVNITSATGIRGYGAAGGAAYTAVKGAEVALTRLWAQAFAQHGIRCNALALGVVLHSPTTGMIEDAPIPLKVFSDAHLLGTGVPDDPAFAAVYLASRESRWMTGSIISLDGGYTCYLPVKGLEDPEYVAYLAAKLDAG